MSVDKKKKTLIYKLEVKFDTSDSLTARWFHKLQYAEINKICNKSLLIRAHTGCLGYKVQSSV
jgi:hypothetical protein